MLALPGLSFAGMYRNAQPLATVQCKHVYRGKTCGICLNFTKRPTMPTEKYMEERNIVNAVRWNPERRGYNRIMRSRFCQWLTTAPNPVRPAHTHSADDGQVGWKRHMVIAHSSAHDGTKIPPKALCGLRARHGWGVDLFIEDLCMRCLKAAIKRKLTLPQP